MTDLPEILQYAMDFHADVRYWDEDVLSWEQQTHERCKPIPYILRTIGMLRLIGGRRIVEIGSLRNAMSPGCLEYAALPVHPSSTSHCCNDGHSTYFWARSGLEIHSVDINPDCRTKIEASYAALGEQLPPNLHLHIPRDGIGFLAGFDAPIDLLYLDGWDKGIAGCADRHLDAFFAARDKLAPAHLLSIDDTDFRTPEGGKDALLTPVLLKSGYIPVLRGRQTVFVKLPEY